MYRLGSEGNGLLIALSASLFLTALGTVSSVVLDRSLQYGRRSLADLTQQLVYYALALLLAGRGWGVWSLAVATLGGTITSTALLWRFSPWKPGFVTSLDPLRQLLRRGAPIQAQGLLSLADECLVPVGLGLALGPIGLGYLAWARSLSLVPHLAAWSVYGRMVLPSLARLQSEPQRLAGYLDRAIAGIGFLVLPIFAVLGGLAWWIVPEVYGSKWLPALPALYWLLAAAALISLFTPYHSALTALGHTVAALRIKMLGVGILWALGAPAGWYFGPEGYAMASLATAIVAAYVTTMRLRAAIPIDPLRALAAPVLCSGFVAAALLATSRQAVEHLGPVLVLMLSGFGYVLTVQFTVRAGWALIDPFALARKIMQLNLARWATT